MQGGDAFRSFMAAATTSVDPRTGVSVIKASVDLMALSQSCRWLASLRCAGKRRLYDDPRSFCCGRPGAIVRQSLPWATVYNRRRSEQGWSDQRSNQVCVSTKLLQMIPATMRGRSDASIYPAGGCKRRWQTSCHPRWFVKPSSLDKRAASPSRKGTGRYPQDRGELLPAFLRR